MPYTPAQIRHHLENNRTWLERSLLAIYNSAGFSDIDSDYLCYVAQWIQSGKHLRKARALMMKYADQLAEMANAR